jgi:hypothetical protein
MTYSGAGRLRYVEAVLQHLETRRDIASDCQNDRELRRGDLADAFQKLCDTDVLLMVGRVSQ